MAEAMHLISQPQLPPLIHYHEQKASNTLLSPSLIQSKTSLSQMHGSTHSDASSIGTTLSTVAYDSDASDTSSASSSSDWDARTTMSCVSTATTALLAHKKKNAAVEIKPLHSQLVLDDLNEMNESSSMEFSRCVTDRDLTYDLYSLFYPYTNLQSLLFSHLHPYIESDYKKIQTHSFNEEDQEQEQEVEYVANMDWNDVDSVMRIQDLITKLLSSSSLTTGIKEENIYLMFSSPSPLDIIQHLRFGQLSHLCEAHIDRFGRRSYHYQKPDHQRKKSQLHFYNHSRVPSSMFGDGDIVGLSDFIEEDAVSEISDDNIYHNNRGSTSVAKIHYHDNDIVMISPRNSKKEAPQIQWQNYAIHSYLYRRTRITANQMISSPAKKAKAPALNKRASNSRHMARYGVSMTPKMYGSQSKMGKPENMFRSTSTKNVSFSVDPPVINTNGRKHARDISAFYEKAQKEGFLEKQNTKSYTNIMNIKQWTKYWCVLWNTNLLVYARSPHKSASHKAAKGRKQLSPKMEHRMEAVNKINLNDIMLPIAISYEATDRYYLFRLNHVNGKNYYVFRTKNSFQRKSWVSNIELMLNNDSNFVEPTQRRKANDKTASCLVM